MSSASTFSDTFLAAVRSVGTAATLAGTGFYLHRRGMITVESKKCLARFSQQVAIPALFFSKIIDCPQNFTTQTCPNVLEHLGGGGGWILFVWPVYVVACGLCVGTVAAWFAEERRQQQPARRSSQRKCILAAVAFANSTGLPITLLSVIRNNLIRGGDTDIASVDPELFLSIYLLMYPVLQWSVGGWLVAPSSGDANDDSSGDHDGNAGDHNGLARGNSGLDDVPRRGTQKEAQNPRTGLSMLRGLLSWNYQLVPQNRAFLSEGSGEHEVQEQLSRACSIQCGTLSRTGGTLSGDDSGELDEHPDEPLQQQHHEEELKVVAMVSPPPRRSLPGEGARPSSKVVAVVPLAEDGESPSGYTSSSLSAVRMIKDTVMPILSKGFQPPVIGALLGLFVGSFQPLRGIFVDMDKRDDDAPLEWFFDGINAIGQAAIPINMAVLGCNLSIAARAKPTNEAVGPRTIASIVIGKLVVMPAVGILTALVLKGFVLSDRIPPSTQSAFYLVLMIVFITPTANNVMVMVDLLCGDSNTGLKEDMAKIIGWQYVVVPVALSLSVMAVVHVATM